MLNAPSRPPTPDQSAKVDELESERDFGRLLPSNDFSVLYLYTKPALVRPPFSSGSKIRSMVLWKRGSLGEMKNTRGAMRIEESKASPLS